MNERFKFRLLSQNDKTQLDYLISTIELNLTNKEFWLPIDETSREHFLDLNWTIFIGCFKNDALVAAAGLFLNAYEYSESLKYLNISGSIAEIGRLMVSPEYRGNDLAYTLSKQLINIAKLKNIDYLLATSHPNNLPSQITLKKLGFSKKANYIKQIYSRDILCMEVKNAS